MLAGWQKGGGAGSGDKSDKRGGVSIVFLVVVATRERALVHIQKAAVPSFLGNHTARDARNIGLRVLSASPDDLAMC